MGLFFFLSFIFFLIFFFILPVRILWLAPLSWVAGSGSKEESSTKVIALSVSYLFVMRMKMLQYVFSEGKGAAPLAYFPKPLYLISK